MIQVKETGLDGCLVVEFDLLKDIRGSFTKIFHEPMFESCGLPTHFEEEYISTSHKGVLRGLHFQVPPKAHGKLVYCSYGEVLDVAVDLRKSSSTYGKHVMVPLGADKGCATYLPEGFAHGFYTLSDTAVIVCCQTGVFDAAADCGIMWDSAGIGWPDMHPVLSDKDQNHVRLENFDSPF